MDWSQLAKLATVIPGFALGFGCAWLIHIVTLKTIERLLQAYKELAESRGEAGNSCKKVLELGKRLEEKLDRLDGRSSRKRPREEGQ